MEPFASTRKLIGLLRERGLRPRVALVAGAHPTRAAELAELVGKTFKAIFHRPFQVRHVRTRTAEQCGNAAWLLFEHYRKQVQRLEGGVVPTYGE